MSKTSKKQNIMVINGSASSGSSNARLIQRFAEATADIFEIFLFDQLKSLPHFDPERSIEDTPAVILNFRESIANADAVLICTPEYVFSVPSGLKNAIEWCVSATVFSDKKIGIITASASGAKGHEELQMIMRTLGSFLKPEATLLIRGIKGKFDFQGNFVDSETKSAFDEFIARFRDFVLNIS